MHLNVCAMCMTFLQGVDYSSSSRRHSVSPVTPSLRDMSDISTGHGLFVAWSWTSALSCSCSTATASRPSPGWHRVKPSWRATLWMETMWKRWSRSTRTLTGPSALRFLLLTLDWLISGKSITACVYMRMWIGETDSWEQEKSGKCIPGGSSG